MTTDVILKISNNVEVINAAPEIKAFIKRNLTFANPLYEEAVAFGRYTRGIVKQIKLYEETTDGTITAPRGFLHQITDKLKQADVIYEIVNETIVEPGGIDFGSIIVLRDYQEKFVSSILNFPYGGIAVAPPGSGKTVSALEVISRLGKKALWLTHTSDLLRQTADRAKTFLPNAEIGLIGSGKWSEGDLTIGLVQTLIRRDLTDVAKDYPLIIIDECHHTPSSTFTNIVTKLYASTIIGLSATPYRKDGLEEIMFNVVGPEIATVKKMDLIKAEQVMPATVIMRNTGLRIDPLITDYAKIMEEVYKSKYRLDRVVGDIIADASSGNICAVLTRTIDYAKRIHQRLLEFGVDASLVYSAEVIYEGRKKKRMKAMPRSEKAENIENFIGGKNNVMVATLRFLAEGFDYRPMNRLFLVNPISPRNRTLVEQACGRVERTYEGKTEAIVYDYVDNHGLLETQGLGREEIYKYNYMEVKHSSIGTNYLL